MDNFHGRSDAVDVLLLDGDVLTGTCCAETGRCVMLSIDTVPYW